MSNRKRKKRCGDGTWTVYNCTHKVVGAVTSTSRRASRSRRRCRLDSEDDTWPHVMFDLIYLSLVALENRSSPWTEV